MGISIHVRGITKWGRRDCVMMYFFFANKIHFFANFRHFFAKWGLFFANFFDHARVLYSELSASDRSISR